MKYNNLCKLALTIAVITIGQVSLASFSTDAQIEYNKGIDFYRAGQIDKSITCFRQAITLNPNYIDAYYNLGSIMEYINNDTEALNAFKQIILRKPDDYEAVYKAAEISHRLGQDDKAQMYLTLIPTDSLIGQKAHQLSQEISSSAIKEETAVETAQEPEKEALTQNENDARKQIYTAQEEAVKQSKPAVEIKSGIYESISSPTGITSDSDGNLYVADFADNLVYKINNNGEKIVYLKNKKIDGPIGLVLDKNNNIYIANYNKDNVLKVDKNGTITVFIKDVPKPYCMYLQDDKLFVSSQGNNAVIWQKLTN